MSDWKKKADLALLYLYVNIVFGVVVLTMIGIKVYQHYSG